MPNVGLLFQKLNIGRFADASAGSSIPAKMGMIAMTTRSSIRVKPFFASTLRRFLEQSVTVYLFLIQFGQGKGKSSCVRLTKKLAV